MFHNDNRSKQLDKLRDQIKKLQMKESELVTSINLRNLELSEKIKEAKSSGAKNTYELKPKIDLLQEELNQGTAKVTQAKEFVKLLERMKELLQGKQIELSDDEIVQLSIGESGALLQKYSNFLPADLTVLSLDLLLRGRELFKQELENLRKTFGKQSDPYNQPEMKALIKLGILLRGFQSEDITSQDRQQYEKGPLGELVRKYARFLPEELHGQEKDNKKSFKL